jgi:hypothetical protein
MTDALNCDLFKDGASSFAYALSSGGTIRV